LVKKFGLAASWWLLATSMFVRYLDILLSTPQGLSIGERENDACSMLEQRKNVDT
jgi:hypothetical protein